MNAVAFFLHPQMVRSTVQQLHFSQIFCTRMTISTLQVFQEEVPRAKARQQLREAQNNDASRGLRQGGYGGGQDSKSTEATNASTSSIRGERIPMHCNLFSLNPQKTSKKPSNNGDSIGLPP